MNTVMVYSKSWREVNKGSVILLKKNRILAPWLEDLVLLAFRLRWL